MKRRQRRRWCSIARGLARTALLNDHEMFPIRGQIMRVGLPRSNTVLMDDREDEDTVFAYIVPRSNDCVIGGTARAGDWSTEPEAGTAIRIVERCSRLSPGVPELPVLEHIVGLRPGRSAVRLEAEQRGRGPVGPQLWTQRGGSDPFVGMRGRSGGGRAGES